jgi:hypothetical protein
MLLTTLGSDEWPEDWKGAVVLPAKSRQGRALWDQQCAELGFAAAPGAAAAPVQPRAIYVRQQQIELSACVIGANPNALAKSYKAGVLSDADIELISTERSKCETARLALDTAAARQARQRSRQKFLDELNHKIKAL